MKTSEVIEIAAGAIRATARCNKIANLTKNTAFEIWDEIARTQTTITARAYYDLTETQRNKVLNKVVR